MLFNGSKFWVLRILRGQRTITCTVFAAVSRARDPRERGSPSTLEMFSCDILVVDVKKDNGREGLAIYTPDVTALIS
jgi:hypothetical protein